MICSQLCINSLQELWKGLLLKAQMHVLLWARMRNQTTADPKKSNQQLMQKCAHEHRNINVFYLAHCQSERKVKREDACWEWAARGEPPQCEMKMEEMWWISETHTHRGENREQKSQHRTSSHLKTCFSSDEPLLAGYPAPEAVPGSVNREKKITIHCHKRHTYESSHHYGDKQTCLES